VAERPFEAVLVANRGEIAVRIMRTLRGLGIRSVAVFSDADAGARHVREADTAVRLGPPTVGPGASASTAAESYLSIERILAAAAASGAQAIHPGYGFLAENAAFARACEQAGVVFIGPPADAIEAMGDKIRAKRTVSAAGVPVVPGRSEPGMSDAEVAAAAVEVGFPVLLKPSAGGGGKGMRLVHAAGALADEIAAARREARGAFGDDTLLVERYLERPRHIEIQVLGDTHGAVVHLGERECSLQRRHQKIVEEAPSPLLAGLGDGEAVRRRMGAAAVEAARAVGYTGAGTVEFIVSADAPGEFFFLEMNTRLQVEHPVTECVTGLDLVEWQLRVAAGEPLGFGQQDVRIDGHAIEARVYAEDPARGFLPTGGPVLALVEPALPSVRVDSGLITGMNVGSTYDPMLAKVIAWGPDRESARRRLDGALADTVVLGLTTNVGFLRALLAHPEVVAGRLDTGLVERHLDALAGQEVPEEVLAAAGLERLLALGTAAGADPWDIAGGWRIGEPAWAVWRIETPGPGAPAGPPQRREVRVRGTAAAAEVCVGPAEVPGDAGVRGCAAPGTPGPAEVSGDAGGGSRAAPDTGPDTAGKPVRGSARWDGGALLVSYGDRTCRYACARDGDVLWLARDGHTWALTEVDRLAAARHEAATGGGPVRSPMPGMVLAVKVAEGERVTAGQALVIVEAMKMEHTLAAPIDGVVTDLPARAGAQVRVDELLAVVTADD
jgi:acetyl-CoA/propionyl-CoA carboxylase biotin carboxyl carrier protein